MFSRTGGVPSRKSVAVSESGDASQQSVSRKAGGSATKSPWVSSGKGSRRKYKGRAA